MTTILIPAASLKPESWQYMKLLLESINRNELWKHYEIVVAFDGCSEEFIDNAYDTCPYINPDTRFINAGRPKNFCGNVNAALRILHGEQHKSVIVVNQDTILPPIQFMKRLEFGHICSATEVVLAQDLTQLEGLVETLDSSQPEDAYYEEVDKIIGFCMFLSKEFLDQVGYLNEYLQASFDDDDLCAKANLLGITIRQSNTIVHHFQNKLGAYQHMDLPIRKNQFNLLWHVPLDVPHAKFQEYIKEHHVWKDEYKEV